MLINLLIYIENDFNFEQDYAFNEIYLMVRKRIL